MKSKLPFGMLVDSCMFDFNNILNVILNRVYIKGAEQRGCPYVHRLYTKGFKKKKKAHQNAFRQDSLHQDLSNHN